MAQPTPAPSPPLGSTVPPTPIRNLNTRASIFSTIIALVLCCLTQPAGSLLFPGRSARLWRVSPLSALLEGAMIFWCLIKLSVRGSWNWSDVRHRLSTTATLLFVLRSRDSPAASSAVDVSDTIRRTLEGQNHRRGIHVWTTVAMLLLVVKLCVVRGAPGFTVFACCYVISWAGVEVVTALAGWEELDDRQIEKLAAKYEGVRKEAEKEFWCGLWELGSGFGGTAMLSYYIYLPVLMYQGREVTYFRVVLLFVPPCCSLIWWVLELNLSSQPTRPVIAGASIYLILVVLFGTGDLVSTPFSTFQPVEAGNILKFRIVFDWRRMPPLILARFIGNYLVAFIAFLPVWFMFYLDDSHSRAWLGSFNVAIFIGALAIYMYWYIPTGTSKPEWLEWIGM
jgi:hypothetical protein